jgi:GTPase SAR1 family protein
MSFENLNKVRSVLVVGKTGSGKSTLLNQLIGENVFKANAGIHSCTNEIAEAERIVKVNSTTSDEANDESSFKLICYDTPGIADTLGRSKDFLNKIAKKIKETPLNQLIILVEYGKHDTSFYVNLEVLRECLNNLSDSSTMIIINKVPTLKVLENKRRKGEEVIDRDIGLKETFAKISEKLDTILADFRYKIYLENDDNDADINAKKYDEIKRIILSSSSNLNATNVRTWDEIQEFYSSQINALTEQQLEEKLEQIKLDYADKLDKVEFDIADNKYPFIDYLDKCGRLSSVLLNSSLRDSKEFVSDFVCSIDKEEYYKRKEGKVEPFSYQLSDNPATKALGNVIGDAATSAAQAVVQSHAAATLNSLASSSFVLEEAVSQLKNLSPPTPVSLVMWEDVGHFISTELQAAFLGIPLPGFFGLTKIATNILERSVTNTIATQAYEAQKTALEQSLDTAKSEFQGLVTEVANGQQKIAVGSLALLAVGFACVTCFVTATKRGLFYVGNKGIQEKLSKLGEKRTELKKELEQCEGTIDQKRKRLSEIKEKISRLNSFLVNPNMANTGNANVQASTQGN